MKLTGKNALVTGAGRGIGEAIALRFAREGADIGLVARNRVELETVAEKIRSHDRRALALSYDLYVEDNVTRMVEDFVTEFGHIDILVNNAGTFLQKGILDMTIEDWDRVVNLNLRSLFMCTKLVLEHMVSRRKGKIINISSGSALRGLPLGSAYSASKGGVNAFTQAVAEEVKEYNLNVNAICPGPVKTGLLDSGPDALQKRFSDLEIMHPEDVANVALFLASEDSKMINGQIFSVRNGCRW
jgi:3-oxoacyl-[acyl-carrier protein] reductase